MTRFYQPDLGENIDSPFIRDGADKLVRRSYWLDMDDRTLVMVMVNGIGANLTNDEKRAHLGFQPVQKTPSIHPSLGFIWGIPV
jgi:hypothetical protein